MSSVTVAVDVAKQIFELAVSSSPGRISERLRLSRSQFERFWVDRLPCRVVMEACATSHYWGRRLHSLGLEVNLIPTALRASLRPPQQNRSDRPAADLSGIILHCRRELLSQDNAIDVLPRHQETVPLPRRAFSVAGRVEVDPKPMRVVVVEKPSEHEVAIIGPANSPVRLIVPPKKNSNPNEICPVTADYDCNARTLLYLHRAACG